jgi:hypothetical protein
MGGPLKTMEPRDISFVVQGAIESSISPLTGEPITRSCLRSLRQHHRGAELILSTWKDADVSGLDYDVLVRNDDPGAWNALRPECGEIKLDNTNRQIVSTKNGLYAATRKYAAKIRSDMIFQGSHWMQYLGRYPRRANEWRIFKERLITCSMWARDPRCPYSRQPLHPPDWVYLGLKEDVLLLWDIDLQAEPESSQWFADQGFEPPLPPPAIPDVRRYSPEQYLWRTLLARYGPVCFEHRGDICDYNIRLTELSFANNLIILDLNQFPFVVHKYPLPLRPWFRYYRFLSHKEWERLYQQYCTDDSQSVWMSKAVDPDFYLKRAYVLGFSPWQRLKTFSRAIADIHPLRPQRT